ncbi:MAG: hypothetical protein AAB427_15970, partial [Chloroflexota bacterium]
MNPHIFASVRTVLLPVVFDCDCESALNAARALAPEVILVGLVNIPPGEPLSSGAVKARHVRKVLRKYADGAQVRSKARVRV